MSNIAKSISSFKKEEVNKIFQTGKRRIKTDLIDIIIAKKVLDFGRILVITSRKVGNAPKRNKIRRRLKSIFYQEKLYDLGYDCIIITKKGAVDLSFDQLKDLLFSALKK